MNWQSSNQLLIVHIFNNQLLDSQPFTPVGFFFLPCCCHSKSLYLMFYRKQVNCYIESWCNVGIFRKQWWVCSDLSSVAPPDNHGKKWLGTRYFATKAKFILGSYNYPLSSHACTLNLNMLYLHVHLLFDTCSLIGC